ncbi:amidase family protein [Labedaea rhizosphaerae]|uniref:Amidase n=1 Tax=Labedaea rhizosphaerae TaxID=598644 RepID=A0A4V3CYZ6_LABRH|nr:amidase family protein [Labedaea rhizosphaerae]TDP96058.1 amidase [Labedaea rhizosphaerae]
MDVDQLLTAGAHAQATALADGSVTAPALTEAALAKIAAHDRELNSFRVVYTDAARAAAADAQRRLDAGERTPLLGVPVAIKDDQDVEGDITGMGGRPQLPPAAQDSPVVARVRASGAVVIGHTNVPDRCLWPFTETLTHGATRNPWNLNHTPGGSSGGSAAAVAAGFVGAATGSDGGGSVRIPAGNCGLYGVKTTRGLVPMQEEGWQGLSVLGPLGPNPADAAALLDVMAGENRYVAATEIDPQPMRIALSWTTPLGRPYMVAERKAAVRRVADELRALGHDVVEADPPLGIRPLPQFLIRYLRGVSGDVDGLPHPEWLESRTRAIARVGRQVPDRVLRWARDAELDLRAIMDGFFKDFDLVLQPGITGAPFRIGRFHNAGAVHTLGGVTLSIPYFPLWNTLGYPVVAIPVGVDRAGLPIGVQVGGPEFSEATLLSLAGQYARAHPPQRPPR